MQKNKIISIILIFVVALSTLFSFSVSNADDSSGTININGEIVTIEEIEENLRKLQTENPFEMAVSEIAIGIGDFLLDYMVFLVKDEITIDRLVFNKVLSLDANFFEANKKGLVPDTTEIICDVVNDWYAFFNGIAIVAYLMILVFIGIKILLRNSVKESKSI